MEPLKYLCLHTPPPTAFELLPASHSVVVLQTTTLSPSLSLSIWQCTYRRCRCWRGLCYCAGRVALESPFASLYSAHYLQHDDDPVPSLYGDLGNVSVPILGLRFTNENLQQVCWLLGHKLTTKHQHTTCDIGACPADRPPNRYGGGG